MFSRSVARNLGSKARSITPVKASTALVRHHHISSPLLQSSSQDHGKRRTMSTAGAPSETAKAQANASPTFESIGVKNTNINEASGVKLSSHQKLLVGSVLDLFGGNPTLKHLSLWSRDATFTDPITNAKGYDKFAAQWYGLPALFNPIQLQSHTVKSDKNPIEIEVSNKYTVKGVKTEKLIDSIVKIFVGADGKIDRVEDAWNGSLPEGAVSDAFRKLNAVSVPTIVKVPKNEEEDMKLKAEREGKSS